MPDMKKLKAKRRNEIGCGRNEGNRNHCEMTIVANISSVIFRNGKAAKSESKEKKKKKKKTWRGTKMNAK